MIPTIADEHVAIVASRAEWAALLIELRSSKRVNHILKDNPETMAVADSIAIDPMKLVDAIAITVVDSQLRIEKGITPNMTRVKVLKSENTMRSAWEPRT